MSADAGSTGETGETDETTEEMQRKEFQDTTVMVFCGWRLILMNFAILKSRTFCSFSVRENIFT